MNSDEGENKTHSLDSFSAGDIRLTLVNYQTGYGFVPEIGYRNIATSEFNLIQWRGIRKEKAWEIAKRMVLKNKSSGRIQKVLNRLEYK